MTVEEVVIECAAAAYRVDASAITPATSVKDDLGNKSLPLLAFVSGIEEELDVTIPMGTAQGMSTIQEFIDKAKELCDGVS
ncbi:MAG: phosphopantetheine-binding protein [Eggerthellaceae bacterium]|nr:phosphopantetheine-binding protein [Eggerthellaceae bacterium]